MFRIRNLTISQVCVPIFALSSILSLLFRQSFVNGRLLTPLVLCSSLLFLITLFLFLFTRKPSLSLTLLVLFCVSFAYALHTLMPFPGPYGRPVVVSARLVSAPLVRGINNEVTVRIKKIRVGGHSISCFSNRKVLMHLPLKGTLPKRGSKVEVKGFFLDLPHETSPEYAVYLRSRGIRALFEAYAEQMHIAAGAFSVLGVADRLRAYVKRVNRRLLPYPQSEFAISIFTGSREDLPPSLIRLFRRSGTMHILAVSGLHIGFISFYFFLILTTLRIQRNVAYMLLIGLVAFYMIFIGDTPSVKRASIMVLCGIAVFLLDRDRDYLNILALAFCVLWLFNPLILQNPGFLLSFSATFGILFLAPHLVRLLQRRMPLFLAGPIAVTLSVQVYVLVVMLAFFKSFSYINIVANLPIVPLAGVSIALELLYLLCYPLFLPFASIFAEVNSVVTTAIVRLAHLFARLEPLRVDSFPVWAIPLYFVIVSLGFSLLLKSLSKRVGSDLDIKNPESRIKNGTGVSF